MKPFIATLSLALLSLNAVAQEKLDFTATVPQGATQVLLYKMNQVDTLLVTNGKVKYAQDSPQPTVSFIVANDSNKTMAPVLSDGAPFALDMTTLTVTGSTLNQKAAHYQKLLMAKVDSLRGLMMQYRTLTEQQGTDKTAKIQALESSFERVMKSRTNLIVQITKDNPNNLIPALFLRDVAQALPVEQMMALTEPTFAYMQEPMMKALREELMQKSKTMPGQMFTDFTLADPYGANKKLSDFAGKGKYVLIDFWASWCGPCIAEMPHVVKAYEKYASKGLEIVGVSLDNKAQAWKDAIKRMGMTWPQLSDLKGWKSHAADLYGVKAIPATVLLGPDGKIIARDLRGEALEEKLADLFKSK